MAFFTEALRHRRATVVERQGYVGRTTLDDFPKLVCEWWGSNQKTAKTIQNQLNQVRFAPHYQPDGLDLKLLGVEITTQLTSDAISRDQGYQRDVTDKNYLIDDLRDTANNLINHAIKNPPKDSAPIQTDEDSKQEYLRALRNMATALINLFPENKKPAQPDKLKSDLLTHVDQLGLARKGE